MLVAGILLAVSMISQWAITRLVPAPFTSEAEEVDFSGVLTKILEAIIAAALVAVVTSTSYAVGAGRRERRSIITVFVISILLAAGVYEMARAA